MHMIPFLMPIVYRIVANISGSELDYTMCRGYNRQGPRCRQCVEGYGPTLMAQSVLIVRNTSTYGYSTLYYFS